MFHQSDQSDDPFAGLPNVEHRRIDIKGDRLNLWEQLRLPLAAKTSRLDLLHCPANTAPRRPGVPIIVTIHDLIPLQPEFATAGSEKWRRNVSAAARKARRVITPSNYSKGQIVKAFGVPADNIIVNCWAPDQSRRKITDVAELNRLRAKYGLDADQPYVFAFGADHPRKNTARMIDAWARVPARLQTEHALLIVGIAEPARTKFRRRSDNLNATGSCILQGFAPEEDISALVSGATVFCYPSLSEGFGLPILDAFVCETAVLAGNTTSVPEVAGDAAMLVDPYNTQAIADGLAELLDDEALRGELIRRGRARLKKFTWQGCAQRFCTVLEEALAEDR